MRALSTLSVMVLTCATAQASPTTEEACAYFSRQVPFVGTATKVEYSYIPDVKFEKVEVALERYSTLISNHLTRSFGVTNEAGQFEQRGKISGNFVCFADFVERRVLWIATIDGPSVGEEITVWNDNKRKVQGPKETLSEIGMMIHQGKY